MNEPRIRVSGILKKDNEILFVKHRKNKKEYYLLPGGGVDFGESFEAALKREFMEEVNIEIKVKDLVFVSEGIDPKGEKHIISMVFLVEYVQGDIRIPEEERIIGCEYLSPEKMKEYLIYPNIKKELILGQFDRIKYLGNIWE